jgi:hypothetical protein
MLIRSSIVAVLTLLLPAIAWSQSPAAPATTGPSSIVSGSASGAHTKGDSLTTTDWILDAEAGVRKNRIQDGFYPTASGFTPDPLARAGAVTIRNASAPTFSKFTDEYQFPNEGFGFFAQSTYYIYKFDRAGYNRTQFGLRWTGGARHRLKY